MFVLGVFCVCVGGRKCLCEVCVVWCGGCECFWCCACGVCAVFMCLGWVCLWCNLFACVCGVIVCIGSVVCVVGVCGLRVLWCVCLCVVCCVCV